MPTCLVLLAPSANHVYAGSAPRLCAAEIALTCPGVQDVEPVTVAGVDYLRVRAEELSQPVLAGLARASATLGCFGVEGDLLRPVELPRADLLDEDLVTIPKYRGKTNEQFTRLLVNLTVAALQGAPARRRDEARGGGQRLTVLDPMCGRGTTLQTAWLAGHDAFGVEYDTKAVEALASHMTTWLRRKRLKHSAGTHPVRREGRAVGRRFDAELRLDEGPALQMGVFTGDTRDSAALWGRRTFDAVVVDAPYGVVHGSHEAGPRKGPGATPGGQRGRGGGAGHRDRSPAALLAEALPVWAGQLRRGGALGMSWNTYGLAREDLVSLLSDVGLVPLDEEVHRRFGHRVDSSIQRDVVVALRP